VFVAGSAAGGSGGGSGTMGPSSGGSGGSGASGGTGGFEMCPSGLVEDCYTGPPNTEGVGICQHGVRICDRGTWSECIDETLPAAEICDGSNNDCDDAIDEGCSCNNGEMQPCYDGPLGTQGVGICEGGMQTCSGGAWGTCDGDVLPGEETCANIGTDDDCTGAVDDFGVCDTGDPGLCAVGNYLCSGNTLICVGSPPGEEVCDGADNDCDGQNDEDLPTQGTFCTIGGCAGEKHCIGGQDKCMPIPINEPEICNDGIDNNCDGDVDPMLPPFFIDSFNDLQNSTWTLDLEWQIGPAVAGLSAPTGFFPDPGQDTTPTADNRLAGVVIGGDATILPHMPRYLTSKLLDISGAPSSVVLAFRRWLSSDAAPLMTSTVEVNEGSKYVRVFENTGQQIADSAWTHQAYDVTAYKNQAFQIRFGVEVGEGDPPQSVGSWSIDDVRLVSCVMPN
jgi:hypothetical protein